MSLLEWLKFWSKFYSLPLFCSNLVQNTPPPLKWKLSESPNPKGTESPPPMKIVRESRSERYRIPPSQMKIGRESKSERFRIPGRSMWRLIYNPRDTTRSCILLVDEPLVDRNPGLEETGCKLAGCEPLNKGSLNVLNRRKKRWQEEN